MALVATDSRAHRFAPLAVAAALAVSMLQPTAADASGTSTDSPASYIVRAVPGAITQLRDAISGAGGAVVRDLAIIDGVEARLTSQQLKAVDGSGWTISATPNAGVQLKTDSYSNAGDAYSMYSLARYLNADDVWAKGYQGQGIDVALIDSGVSTQPGIEASRLVYGPDLTPESIDPATRNLDTYGHGTHLASIIAGKDASITNVLSPGASGFVGIAPRSRIVSVKAGDAAGNTDVSQVIAAISWVAQHKSSDGLNIRVLNLSFGTDSVQSYQLDPLSFAVEQAWKKGLVVVVSAGNSNNNSSQLSNPAINPYVIAVGAMDTMGTPDKVDDMVASWSARGTTRIPDVAAPGVHVQGLRTPGSYVDTHYSGGVIGTRFLRGSGSSQAAAIVSGAAALLLSARPGLTPDQLKAILKATAYKMPRTDPQPQGNGEIDILAAHNKAAWSTTQTWPSASGTGSLEAARGGTHLVFEGVELTGERDINGRSWSSSAMATAISRNTAWSGGYFNGVSWAGAGWEGGNAWASKVYQAGGWAGSSWRGSSWRNTDWQGGNWNGSSWRYAGWSGSSWRGSQWRNSAWSGYADASWSSTSWN